MSGPPAGDGLPEGVVALLPEYLRRQRWFGGDQAPDAASVRVLDAAELTATADGAHRLLWAIVGVTGGPPGAASDGDVAEEAADAGAGPPAAAESSATVRYQLLIGERPNGEHAEF
ncbi:MAG: hypothetical protein QOK20_472, partial [Acidimicrobiaceae bacterium]|nr:hypothetical protein [Acidimicrobiaceae bacterium]